MRTWPSVPSVDDVPEPPSSPAGDDPGRPIRGLYRVETDRRGRTPREDLTDRARQFADQVRAQAPIDRIARDFPHLANRFARLAGHPWLLAAAIDEVLVDDRTDREGFPFAVLQELLDLRELHAAKPGPPRRRPRPR
jgi:hypothetical protein